MASKEYTANEKIILAYLNSYVNSDYTVTVSSSTLLKILNCSKPSLRAAISKLKRKGDIELKQIGGGIHSTVYVLRNVFNFS